MRIVVVTMLPRVAAGRSRGCRRLGAAAALIVGCWILAANEACVALQDQQATKTDHNAAFIGYKEGERSDAAAKPQFEHFVLSTQYGEILITPRRDISPKIVSIVQRLAEAQHCPSCKFYRHEPAPSNFGQGGFFGPPYALLQGSLADMTELPPFEGAPKVQKGDVCIIPGSKEFFIATAGHEEWEHAHSVWGQVTDPASWVVIGTIPMEPFTTITDRNITTRWLTAAANVPFTLSVR